MATGTHPIESITRNTAFVFAAQVTTAVFTAVLTIYLARVLGPGEFGVFSLALGIGLVVLLPADFGISNSAARFIAERRGDPQAVAEVLRTALRMKLTVAAAVCGAMFAVAGPLADAYDEPGLGWALRGIALALFGQNLLQLYSAAFQAMAVSSVNFRVVLSKSVVEVAASIGLVAAGAGATGAAFGRAAGYLAAAALGVILVARLLGRDREGRTGFGWRPLAGYASALLIIDGAWALFTQIDVLLIGAFIGAGAVGLFQAPMRLTALLHNPGQALAAGVAPRVARHARYGPSVQAFEMGLRYLVIFQMALVPPVLVWAEPLTELLLGGEYAESAEVLRALAPTVFLAGLAPLVSLALNYLGEARRRIPIALGALALNFVIDVLLIPRIGIIAGAIGTNAAYALYVPAHFVLCRRMLGLRLRPLGVTFARSLAAATGMSAVLLAFGTQSVAIPMLAAGGLLGVAAFGAVLWGTGELTPAELVNAARTARTRFRARTA